MRIGDILRDEGVVTEADIDQALRSQRGLGGRLGTNLIENGAAQGDQIALALARQKGVPAVRRKHFEAADPSLHELLPKFLVERHNAVPIAMATRFGRELVVAFMDPDNIAAVEAITEVAGMRIRPSVAPEFYIIHYLEALYGIPPRRFLRKPLVNSIELEEPSETHNRPSGWGRSITGELGRLEPTIAPAGASGPALRSAPRANTLERELDAGWDLPEPTPAPRASVSAPLAPPAPLEPAPTPRSADATVAALAEASSKEAIADALVGFMSGAFGGGLVFVIKKGSAIGWRGYARGVASSSLEAISLSLDEPSSLRDAFSRRAPVSGAPDPAAAALHGRLWSALGMHPPAEIAVAPIVIKDRVVNLAYAHAADGGPLPEGTAADLMRVCAAASNAYVSLIKRSKAS